MLDEVYELTITGIAITEERELLAFLLDQFRYHLHSGRTADYARIKA